MSSVRRERRFKFRGGVPCLDFVNTLAWRLTDCPVEYLLSYEDLLAWGRQASLLTLDEKEVLSRCAAMDPEEARGTLSRAFALREAVHGVLSAAIAGEPQDEDALAALNHELSGALSRLRVAPVAGDTYVWAWERGGYCQVCVHKSLMWDSASQAGTDHPSEGLDFSTGHLVASLEGVRGKEEDVLDPSFLLSPHQPFGAVLRLPKEAEGVADSVRKVIRDALRV